MLKLDADDASNEGKMLKDIWGIIANMYFEGTLESTPEALPKSIFIKCFQECEHALLCDE